jgi:hypothetical protein
MLHTFFDKANTISAAEKARKIVLLVSNHRNVTLWFQEDYFTEL